MTTTDLAVAGRIVAPPPRTKSDQAYRVLRRAIVMGQVEADAPLDEDVLMATFGLGRTPLREALKRLAYEEFVSWPPHSTPFVRNVTPQDLHRLFEARLVLEEPVARLAAERLDEPALDELEALSAAIEAAIKERAIYEAVELDHGLHLAIARGSGNRFLVQAVDRLNCGSLRLWYVAHERLNDKVTQERHRDLVDALRAHDPERAGLEARRHVLRFHERQMELLRSAITAFPPPVTGDPSAASDAGSAAASGAGVAAAPGAGPSAVRSTGRTIDQPPLAGGGSGGPACA